MSQPRLLARGSNGDVYVPNYAGGSSAGVLRFDGSGASLGVFATSPDGPQVCAPGMVFLPAGDLLVAEQNSNTIQRYHGATGQLLGEFASGALVNSPELRPPGSFALRGGLRW